MCDDEDKLFAEAGDAVTDATWTRIERQFRVWSFRVYYDKLYATETDNTLRFAKAIIASSQPIRDRQKVLEWYALRRRRFGRRSAPEESNGDDA